MQIWFYTLVSVFIVSIISLIGVLTLSFNKKTLSDILLYMVSFAVGGLFGDAFIHLIPEAFDKLGKGILVSSLIIFGILVFFVLEKFIRWRHCHVVTSKDHPHPVVLMNLIGDGLHNMIDGMIIGATYLISIPLGLTTTLAVILHEIPQEIGEFGVLVHGGLSVKNALLFNFLSALLAIVGAIFSLTVGPYIKDYAAYLIPITAGGFIYLAGSDLIPELHHESEVKRSCLQFICILLGIATMALLLLVG